MLEGIQQAVLEGDYKTAGQLVEFALSEGIKAPSVLNDAMIPAMDIVGREYETGIRYIPEMLISAEAMREGMKVLRPYLADAEIVMRGVVVIGTVKGDMHDIGKDLVGMMLEGAGFQVIDLGIEVTAQRFVESILEHHANVVAMSALLTTTMTYMLEVVKAIEAAQLRASVRIIVGGAPVTKEYADRIGVDGYASDAPGAVALVRRLLSGA